MAFKSPVNLAYIGIDTKMPALTKNAKAGTKTSMISMRYNG
jgi:hypothetical protein